MSEVPEEWTDARLVKRCLAGDETALERLTALYRLARDQCLALCRRQQRQIDRVVIEDAAQDVFLRLLEDVDAVLAGFTRKFRTLEDYLAHLIWRRVDALLRADQRRHEREQTTADRTDSEERRPEPGPREERAENLLSRLRGKLRTVLEKVLDGTFSAWRQKPSKEARRQIVHRIRQKLKELEAEEGKGDPPPEEKK